MYDFVLDSMLGREARWLRVLGYSVYYSPSASDVELIKLAESGSGCLVTRDRELYNLAFRRGVRAILLGSQGLENFLLEMAHKAGIKLEIDLRRTRCPLCNGTLRRAGRDELTGVLPSSILSRYRTFLKCEGCGHVYWPGTHFRRMKDFIMRVASRDELPPSQG